MSRPRKRRGGGGGLKAGVSLTGELRAQKIQLINRAIEQDPVDVDTLRRLAISPGGLLTHEMRRRAWPKLVGTSVVELTNLHPMSDEQLQAHRDWRQVLLDVRRCYRRFPKDMRHSRRRELHQCLMRLIMTCMCLAPNAYYYQGFHDIAACWLLTIGEDAALAVLLRVVGCHLLDLLDSSFDRLRVLMSSLLLPVVASRDKELAIFMKRADVDTMFCLPWVISWFSHSLDSTETVTRLHDFFLASHPLMTVYLSAAIVVHRRQEVLQQDCEFVSIHSLLSHLPEDLPFDDLVQDAAALFDSHPPRHLASGKLKSLSVSQYNDFLSELSNQRPDRILQKFLSSGRNNQQTSAHRHTTPNTPKEEGSEETLTQRAAKAAVWGLSASIGVASVLLWTATQNNWL